MKRTPAAIVLLAVALTSGSAAAASDGPGPFGVTVVVADMAPVARVGVPFDAEGHRHFCTASVVHSLRRDLIVTAAHCLTGDDLLFAPAYRNGHAPYGMWHVTRRFLPGGWATGQDEDSDVAFAVLAPLHGKRVEDVVGANRFVTRTTTGAIAVTSPDTPTCARCPSAVPTSRPGTAPPNSASTAPVSAMAPVAAPG